MTEEDAKQTIIDTFPKSCPLRQHEIIHNNVLGLDYCVFEIDSDHAIVSFGGTKSIMEIDVIAGAADTIADIQLLLGETPPTQSGIANNVVADLPYENIIVTGYSLGGYLAADVRLNLSNKVARCVTFNAPGRSVS